MFDAGYRMLGAGARGWSREMIWGGRWEGGSWLGTHVHPWRIHVNVWQNQYSIVKKNKVKIKIKKKKCWIQHASKFGKQQWTQDWKRLVFIPIPKKGNAKECSNYCTIVLILHASKEMLKILQARLQQYMNWELPDVQLDLEKAEEPEIKLPTSVGSQKKLENSPKNIYFCFTDHSKVFDCVAHNELWKVFKEMGIPDHLTRLWQNLYVGQEATVRTDMEQ